MLLRRFILATLLCVLLAGLVYVIGVRTDWGQQADNAVFEGRLTASVEARRNADQILRLITRPSLALMGGALVLVGLWRGRWRLALAAGSVVGGATVSAELAKSLLERPGLRPEDPVDFNSWPSGHVTIVTALSLALVMVVPRRYRWPAAAAACVAAAIFGMAVVPSGWHRPADAMGGYLIAAGWACGVTAVLLAWRGSGPGETAAERPRHPSYLVAAVLALVAFVSLVAVVLLSRGSELSAVESSRALVLALIQIAALGVVVVAGYTILLDGADLDTLPGPEGAPQRAK